MARQQVLRQFGQWRRSISAVLFSVELLVYSIVKALLTSCTLGDLELKNYVVMATMTHSRTPDAVKSHFQASVKSLPLPLQCLKLYPFRFLLLPLCTRIARLQLKNAQ